MSAMAISGIVFACVLGGALLGNFLRTVLPEHHLTADSKDVVKLGMGLIATMAALVLGLLIASAKGSYDTQRNALTQVSANIVLLDRVLAHYGAETQEARAMLHRAVVRVIDQLWPEHNARAAELDPTADGGEALYEKIQALSPQNEAQRSLQAKALGITMDTADALVDVRAGGQFDPRAVFVGAGLLAHHYLHQLRSVCGPQRNRQRHAAPLCAIGFGCDLPDS